MIDWSLAKKGATVHFRCNGKVVLAKDSELIPEMGWYRVYYSQNGFNVYSLNGTSDAYLSPFDIISITPVPEPKKIVGYVNVYEVGFSNIITYLNTALECKGIMEPIDTLEITWTENGEPTIKSVREK